MAMIPVSIATIPTALEDYFSIRKTAVLPLSCEQILRGDG
jgi:hypothetical protein